MAGPGGKVYTGKHYASVRQPFQSHYARKYEPSKNSTIHSSGSGRASEKAAKEDLSRRALTLNSFGGILLLGEIMIGQNSARTVINSILGGYGLPKLKASSGTRQYNDLESGVSFSVPTSWVERPNHLRPGVYISDFDTADKVVLEVFGPESSKNVQEQLVEHFINPASEIGGDARLSLPPSRQIKSEEHIVDGQTYLYVEFPSETVTRSGYQIRRRNFGVAHQRREKLLTLVASARADKYNAEKKALLTQIVASFRVDT